MSPKIWTAREAEDALLRVGLDPASFDLDATAADLQQRCELNDSLDELIDRSGELESFDPVSGFDPRWD